MSLLTSFKNSKLEAFQSSWQSPANIALVKYWGKKGHQLPANPSLSMTLKQCLSQSKVSFTPAEKLAVTLNLAGSNQDSFASKIEKYLLALQTELPFLSNLSVHIESKNTFPHGAGIASSASGLSAFALCLTDYLYAVNGMTKDESFYQRASYLSRLASGSACRSVYGGFVAWGESSIQDSSDEFATTLRVHPEIEHLQDTVLIISPHLFHHQ